MHKTLSIMLLMLLIACNGRDSDANLNQKKITPDHSSPAALLTTLGTIIKEGREELLFATYTRRSIEAIKHNNKTGIGTAGTVDGLLREEIAIRIAQRPNQPAEKKATPKKKLPEKVRSKPFAAPAIINSKNGLLTVRWPSGNRSSILFVKENKRWLVDILNGPGGEILLMKE